MGIESKELLSFHYYTYGEPFTGSFRGMRYRLSREAYVSDETSLDPDGQLPAPSGAAEPASADAQERGNDQDAAAGRDRRPAYQFEAAVWPEPYAEAFTDPDLIIRRRFPFSEEGKETAADWMNAVYPEVCSGRESHAL